LISFRISQEYLNENYLNYDHRNSIKMNKKKLRKILFFQGNKKELEEMTGENYEFINPNEVDRLHTWGGKEKEKIGYTFCFLRAQKYDRLRLKEARADLAEMAQSLNADAIIHYREGTNQIAVKCRVEEGRYWNYLYAEGTPVRKL